MPNASGGGGDVAAHVLRERDVGRAGADLGARFGDRVRGRLEALLITVDEQDPRARAAHRDAGCGADATAAAGDDGGPPPEIHGEEPYDGARGAAATSATSACTPAHSAGRQP